MTHVANDADDLGRHLVRPLHHNSPPYRAPIVVVSLYECLVHDHDARAFHAVLPIECATDEHGDPHRREIASAYERTARRERLRRITPRRLFLEPEPRAAVHAAERQKLDRSGSLYTGHAGDAIENLIEQRDSRLRPFHAEEQLQR